MPRKRLAGSVVRKWVRADKTAHTCGNCGSIYVPRPEQIARAAGGGIMHVCSTACRVAIRQAEKQGPPSAGPCRKCGKMFHTYRKNAMFCSMDCYTSSAQFIAFAKASPPPLSDETRAKRAATAAKKLPRVPCPACGAPVVPVKNKGTLRKYCNRSCYRAYMAQRFDRWIADPHDISTLQGYDAFLDTEELPCLVTGCGWVGRHLGLHVNLAHGISATEFKRAAGFNLHTGLVGKEVSQKMRDAAHNRPNLGASLGIWQDRVSGTIRSYVSREGTEHRKKYFAERTGSGPSRTCCGCSTVFVQATPSGHRKFCSVPCRTENYKRAKAAINPKIRTRDARGLFVWVRTATDNPKGRP